MLNFLHEEKTHFCVRIGIVTPPTPKQAGLVWTFKN